jgi:hypothetical protein
LRKKAVAWLENKLQTKVEIGRIYIGLPRKITLENVYLEDRQKDTLLSGGSLKANISPVQTNISWGDGFPESGAGRYYR